MRGPHRGSLPLLAVSAAVDNASAAFAPVPPSSTRPRPSDAPSATLARHQRCSSMDTLRLPIASTIKEAMLNLPPSDAELFKPARVPERLKRQALATYLHARRKHFKQHTLRKFKDNALASERLEVSLDEMRHLVGLSPTTARRTMEKKYLSVFVRRTVPPSMSLFPIDHAHLTDLVDQQLQAAREARAARIAAAGINLMVPGEGRADKVDVEDRNPEEALPEWAVGEDVDVGPESDSEGVKCEDVREPQASVGGEDGEGEQLRDVLDGNPAVVVGE